MDSESLVRSGNTMLNSGGSVCAGEGLSVSLYSHPLFRHQSWSSCISGGSGNQHHHDFRGHKFTALSSTIIGSAERMERLLIKALIAVRCGRTRRMGGANPEHSSEAIEMSLWKRISLAARESESDRSGTKMVDKSRRKFRFV